MVFGICDEETPGIQFTFLSCYTPQIYWYSVLLCLVGCHSNKQDIIVCYMWNVLSLSSLAYFFSRNMCQISLLLRRHACQWGVWSYWSALPQPLWGGMRRARRKWFYKDISEEPLPIWQRTRVLSHILQGVKTKKRGDQRSIELSLMRFMQQSDHQTVKKTCQSVNNLSILIVQSDEFSHTIVLVGMSWKSSR